MELLEFFGAYDFVVREVLALVPVALGVYILLQAGIFAVPQVGFMAIGGYTFAIMATRTGAPFGLSLLLGACIGGLGGFALAVLLQRLDGITLAIASIGFNEIVRVVAANVEITGGISGITGLPRTFSDGILIVSVALPIVVLFRLRGTHFGLVMRSMRRDLLMTSHQGVQIARTKASLFAVMGALSALGGVLHTELFGFIEPNRFGFTTLVQVLAAVILGGLGSPIGPLLGLPVVRILPVVMGGLEELQRVFVGAIIVLTVVFGQQGMVGGLKRATTSIRSRVGRDSTAEGAQLALALDSPKKPTENPDGGRQIDTVTHSHDLGSGDKARNSDEGALSSDRATLLEVDNLSKDFGGIRAVDSVSLNLTRGEVFGLIGPNGSGKSTLLNLLSGVYIPDGGRIILNGALLTRGGSARPAVNSRAGVARTFQGIRLLPGESVIDNVCLGGYLRQTGSLAGSLLGTKEYRKKRHEIREHAIATLARLDIEQASSSLVAALPYGVQRKVEIARALMSDPTLLLLDEPTAGMNPEEREEIFSLITKLQRDATTIIVVEHDVDAVINVSDRLGVLNFGRLIAMGAPGDVIEEEKVIEAYLGKRRSSS